MDELAVLLLVLVLVLAPASFAGAFFLDVDLAAVEVLNALARGPSSGAAVGLPVRDSSALRFWARLRASVGEIGKGIISERKLNSSKRLVTVAIW